MSEIETVRLSTQWQADGLLAAKSEVLEIMDALTRNAVREGIDPDWKTFTLEFEPQVLDEVSFAEQWETYERVRVYATVKGVKL